MKNEKETKKTRFFYVVKVKITSLFTSRYELRYLLINDIMQLIFKWQQKIIKQKVLTNTIVRRIRYSIFITRFSAQTIFFRTINKILRIRCSIMFFRVIEYFHFRRLFSRLHKEQRTIVKNLRRKNICSQERICN
jgi:hypothetical protein